MSSAITMQLEFQSYQRVVRN